MSHIPELLTTGQVVSAHMTYFDAIAHGMVKNAVADHKFGDNDAVSTKATLWDEGGIYEYIDAASKGTAKVLKVSSTSVNDVMTTGTGAHTVTLYGLDANWDEISDTVELNGQTAVNTSKEFLRHYRNTVETAGTLETADGDIYVGDGAVAGGVPATVYSKIQQGNNQTLMAMISVPRGKEVLIPRWYANVGQGKEAVIDAVARDTANGNVFQLKQRRRLYQNALVMPQAIFFQFPEKWDLEIRATSLVATAVCAGFDYAVVDVD